MAVAKQGPRKKTRKSGGRGSRTSLGRYLPDDTKLFGMAVCFELCSDAARELVYEKRYSEVDLKNEKNIKGVNVITAAVRQLRSRHEHLAKRKVNSLRAGVIKHFRAKCQSDTPGPHPVSKLKEEDHEFLKNALTYFTWEDECGNERRHTDLMHFKATREKIVETQTGAKNVQLGYATYQLAALERIQKESKRGLKSLTKFIAKHYQLRQVKEKFKVMRDRSTSMALSEMLSTERQMACPYVTRESCGFDSDGYPLQWDRLRSMRWVPPVDPNSKKQPRAEPLYFDEGAWQITGCLDGCTLMVEGDVDFDAHLVYVTQGEMLNVYNTETAKDTTKSEKQYFMNLALSGCPAIAVAMASGCNKTQDESALPLWYTRLVELGLGSAELEAELRARDWKVCNNIQLTNQTMHSAFSWHGSIQLIKKQLLPSCIDCTTSI